MDSIIIRFKLFLGENYPSHRYKWEILPGGEEVDDGGTKPPRDELPLKAMKRVEFKGVASKS